LPLKSMKTEPSLNIRTGSEAGCDNWNQAEPARSRLQNRHLLNIDSGIEMQHN